jgi:adenylyl-sulfate kinase
MSESIVLWFTGLSGAGKSTIADAAAERLRADGYRVRILDGDDVRERYHRHLGFSPEDIRENNRLISELCREAIGEADVILVPVISPFRDARDAARATIGTPFHEIYIRASVATVTSRDTKGLYAKASRGELSGLIGVDRNVPYEPPASPELTLDTESEDAGRSAGRLVEYAVAQLRRRA